MADGESKMGKVQLAGEGRSWEWDQRADEERRMGMVLQAGMGKLGRR